MIITYPVSKLCVVNGYTAFQYTIGILLSAVAKHFVSLHFTFEFILFFPSFSLLFLALGFGVTPGVLRVYIQNGVPGSLQPVLGLGCSECSLALLYAKHAFNPLCYISSSILPCFKYLKFYVLQNRV